ncbi:5-hydroxytryptamine receptor-like [Anneissia japonica]|uniref:5-hydroxytryptamine receptor-like n=1 Tax=Anneissia japonica TaxID=1529436 RepID=UPI001425A638|nr:5-hydroxytryptamine receptor-like [Anneissia japonica]
MCSVVWFVATISSVPHIILSKHIPCVDSTGDIRYTCTFSFDKVYFSVTYFISVPVLFFFCPVIFLSVIYAKVGLTLRRHDEFIASMREQKLFKDTKGYTDDSNVRKDTREMTVFLGFRMMGICGVDGYASANNAPNTCRRLSREKLIRDETHANTNGNGNVKSNNLRKNNVCSDIDTLPEYPSNETSSSDRRFSQVSASAQTIVKANPESSSSLAKLTRPNAYKTPSNVSYQRQHHIRIVFMLICVVISFFICWLPFRILNLWVLISPTTMIPAVGISGFYGIVIFARVMIYLNSAINPILYNAISSKFRAAFRAVCCGKPRNNRRRSRYLRSTSSFPSNPQSRRSQVDQV